MKTYLRKCIKPFVLDAQNGDHFEMEVGKEYLTSEIRKDGDVVVFTKFWVPVPKEYFNDGVEGI
jgi:hypothetical protein